MEKILIIDDDVDMCLLLKHFLVRKGYDVIERYSGTEALAFLENAEPDLIISDLMLGDMDGIELLKKVKANNINVPFIIITAYEDIATSVKAISHGAFDYITKPILPEEIYTTVKKAIDIKEKNDKSILKGNFTHPMQKEHILATTESWKRILNQISLIAPTDYNIIIYGETGSGKKAIGREIHEQGARSAMPFIVVNCGTLSNDVDDITRYIEAANGGTLFLENITLLSMDVQRFLLNVLKERKIKSAANKKIIELNIRIIASSNEIVWNEVVAGNFIEALFHRINGFNIEVFSLRNRKDDIMPFASHFLKLANQKFEKYIKGFTADATSVLENYTWPGNLYELNNIITKAVLLNTNDDMQIVPDLFPEEIKYFNGPHLVNKAIFTGNVSQQRN